MLLEIAVDALVGAVPVFGDVFKANRRNLILLERGARMPQEAAVLSGGFLALVAAAVILLPTLRSGCDVWLRT